VHWASRARAQADVILGAEASRPGQPLTVAIPSCNGAAHINAALNSILSQDDVSFDLVVSDDRSDDETLDLVRRAAGDSVRISVNSERLGLAGNWNRCVSLAATPYVAVFHQDDVMTAGHLSSHLKVLSSDESVGMAASASTVIDERGAPVPESVVGRGGLGPLDRLFDPGELAGWMAVGNPLRCSAVTLRVAAHAGAGGFDPAYRYVVDWEFWLRLSRNWKLAWRSRPTVAIRWHRASETQRFSEGIADLDEGRLILEQLVAVDWRDRRDLAQLRRTARGRLARAYLARAHDALSAGRAELAREALRHGLKCSPGLIATILADPRLGIKMATVATSPTLAARLFRRSSRTTPGSTSAK
jgi:glycosyltransferase involved in cell wall biosynthesis